MLGAQGLRQYFIRLVDQLLAHDLFRRITVFGVRKAFTEFVESLALEPVEMAELFT